MQEIFIDVGKHAGRSLERMVRSLEADIFVAILVGRVARQDGGDVEYDGRFFVRERVLRRGLVGKGIKPKSGTSQRRPFLEHSSLTM